MKYVKKILLWLVVAFFIYAIIMSPGQAADIIQNAWNLVVMAFEHVGDFFSAILNKN